MSSDTAGLVRCYELSLFSASGYGSWASGGVAQNSNVWSARGVVIVGSGLLYKEAKA